MGQLQDQVAVVTGASTGIGKSIAAAFSAESAKVVLTSRSREKLDAAAKEIGDAGGSALVVPANVSVESDVDFLFKKTMEAFGRVDILINNAGITTKAPTHELTLAAWQSVIDVNLTGAFLCSREAFKIMMQQKSGRILNIGSISAKVPRPNSAPYVTSKFGLEGFTRSLALDGREHGISVCILHPGNTATPIWEGREEQAQKEGVMSPDDLARVALTMATLPPDVNVLESVVLPVKMPFLGRG